MCSSDLRRDMDRIGRTVRRAIAKTGDILNNNMDQWGIAIEGVSSIRQITATFAMIKTLVIIISLERLILISVVYDIKLGIRINAKALNGKDKKLPVNSNAKSNDTSDQ
jgi:hypothetical protein